jgi:hypothetical protein
MKKFLIVFFATFLFSLLLGAVKYMDNNQLGYPVYPLVISDSPSAPFTCDIDQKGKVIYVDDNDDGAEAYLCFCGVDADDTNYEWFKYEAPATDCFP